MRRDRCSLYAPAVTSCTSRQYGASMTLWAGCSSSVASRSPDPMKNIPPGMSRMPSGHAGGTAAADATGATGDDGAGRLSGGAATGARRLHAKPATAPSTTMPAASALARPRTPLAEPRLRTVAPPLSRPARADAPSWATVAAYCWRLLSRTSALAGARSSALWRAAAVRSDQNSAAVS